MLFRAIALFVILNSILLATESRPIKPKPPQNKWDIAGRCYAIKDATGRYLTVSKDKQDTKLFLSEKYKDERSQFKFEKFISKKNFNQVYHRIISCYNGQRVSWTNQYKVEGKPQNYYVYTGNFKGVKDLNKWIIKREGNSDSVEIVDANSRIYNLFSPSPNRQDTSFALVYGNQWPYRKNNEGYSKKLWTIHEIQKHHGGSIALAASNSGEAGSEEQDLDEGTPTPIPFNDDNEENDVDQTTPSDDDNEESDVDQTTPSDDSGENSPVLSNEVIDEVKGEDSGEGTTEDDDNDEDDSIETTPQDKPDVSEHSMETHPGLESRED